MQLARRRAVLSVLAAPRASDGLACWRWRGQCQLDPVAPPSKAALTRKVRFLRGAEPARKARALPDDDSRLEDAAP